MTTSTEAAGVDDTTGRPGAPEPGEPKFVYVEELVRHELSKTLGGIRGMLEGALPFIAFTITWVASRQLTWALGAAFGIAAVLAVIRLVQKQSLKFVAQAVLPTAIAAIVALRTGNAQDVFLPGILYNGGLALVSILTIVARKPLIGFIIGAAMGDPTGWLGDKGLVKMTAKLTAVLAVPYVARFVIQLPLFLAGPDMIVWLGVSKVVLGWPLLLLALLVIGILLSRGRTPIEDSGFAKANLDPEAQASPPADG